MTKADRTCIAELAVSVENFNRAEVDCALELTDIYLNNKNQADDHVAVAGNSASMARAYACWGPVPLTSGTYDLTRR